MMLDVTRQALMCMQEINHSFIRTDLVVLEIEKVFENPTIIKEKKKYSETRSYI